MSVGYAWKRTRRFPNLANVLRQGRYTADLFPDLSLESFIFLPRSNVPLNWRGAKGREGKDVKKRQRGGRARHRTDRHPPSKEDEGRKTHVETTRRSVSYTQQRPEEGGRLKPEAGKGDEGKRAHRRMNSETREIKEGKTARTEGRERGYSHHLNIASSSNSGSSNMFEHGCIQSLR